MTKNEKQVFKDMLVKNEKEIQLCRLCLENKDNPSDYDLLQLHITKLCNRSFLLKEALYELGLDSFIRECFAEAYKSAKDEFEHHNT